MPHLPHFLPRLKRPELGNVIDRYSPENEVQGQTNLHEIGETISARPIDRRVGLITDGCGKAGGSGKGYGAGDGDGREQHGGSVVAHTFSHHGGVAETGQSFRQRDPFVGIQQSEFFNRPGCATTARPARATTLIPPGAVR